MLYTSNLVGYNLVTERRDKVVGSLAVVELATVVHELVRVVACDGILVALDILCSAERATAIVVAVDVTQHLRVLVVGSYLLFVKPASGPFTGLSVLI